MRSARVHFLLYTLVFIAGACALAAILRSISPSRATWYHFITVYASVAAIAGSAWGWMSTIFIRITGNWSSASLASGRTLRRSAFVASLAGVGLFLQSQALLSAPTGLLLVTVVGLLELYFLNRKRLNE